MFIAKMHTRYPDYHGTGYYNFLMEKSQEALDEKIEEYSHDFSHEGTVKTRHESVEALTRQFPTKAVLNDKYFTKATK